ncbi:hypothetical protein [Haloarcula sp. JP-L23]|uniref:hypothetical protein n=1 Tax=Haloarcula sp. JP-L23 TaxID=2716717 RepID=UPI00140EC62F|nr:hypothetical protein G9465_19285 [Haloarcula sp. JP-L23]
MWCQGDEYDLFIVQVLFDKDDEDQIYAKMGAFQGRALDLNTKFCDRETEWIAGDEWRDRDDVMLFTPGDVENG